MFSFRHTSIRKQDATVVQGGPKISLCFSFKLRLHSLQHGQSGLMLLCFVDAIFENYYFATRFRCGELRHKCLLQICSLGLTVKVYVKSSNIW